MSAPARCHTCGHKAGPRSTGNTTSGGIPKKAACNCACHVKATVSIETVDRAIESVLLDFYDREIRHV